MISETERLPSSGRIELSKSKPGDVPAFSRVAGCASNGQRYRTMATTKKIGSRKPMKKTSVAGKPSKDGITGNFRIKGKPEIHVKGQTQPH
jgi:hypothetical protein